MFHCTEDMLRKYSHDALEDNEKTNVEIHLEQCDLCFEKYLKCLAEDESSPLSHQFTEDTVQQIVAQHPGFSSETKKGNRQTKTLLHYTLAAGLTLFFMMSGVFQYVAHSFDTDSFEHHPSLSEKMMEKTDGLFNEITFTKEDNTHE